MIAACDFQSIVTHESVNLLLAPQHSIIILVSNCTKGWVGKFTDDDRKNSLLRVLLTELSIKDEE